MKTGNKIFHSAAPVTTDVLKLSLCMSHQIMNIREKNYKSTGNQKLLCQRKEEILMVDEELYSSKLNY